MPVSKAAEYIKWVIEQPEWLNINEISIDPIQSSYWNKNPIYMKDSDLNNE